MQLRAGRQNALIATIRQEQRCFAAKIRIVRAILGWSQSDLAREVGVTQRSIHKLEQGETEPRRATLLSVMDVWRRHNIAIEDLPDGTFRVTVPPAATEAPKAKGYRGNPDRLRVVTGSARYRA